MKILIYDARDYDRESFERANVGHQLVFTPKKLSAETAKDAEGFDGVCIFVNDQAQFPALNVLKQIGVNWIGLRCAGFNQIDLSAAKNLGLSVSRVPEYSPEAVAEHAFALLLSLNRQIHRAHSRVREGNFSLEGLVGFNLHKKTIGVIGAGKIGKAFCRIAQGFGMVIQVFDPGLTPQSAKEINVKLCDLLTLFKSSDIISLHLPLNEQTKHIINKEALDMMKRGAFLVNTSRGALVDTSSLILALKSGHLGGAALDVYEEEGPVFFDDHSAEILQDDQLARLLMFPNVILTSHQAFLTHEALDEIALVTLSNAERFEKGEWTHLTAKQGKLV